MKNVETARNALEDLLVSQEDTASLKKAAQLVMQEADPEGLQLLAQVLELVPETGLLDQLWDLANRDDVLRGVRKLALQAIAGLLANAHIALERETEANFLSQEELDAQVERLLAFYRDENRHDDLRRRALEMAANVSDSPNIIAEGEKALASDDPKWAGTGLFVCRICQPDRARELVQKGLDHSLADVRFEAIAGLAELGEDDDYERIKDFIYDGSADERSAALWALVEIPDTRAGDALVEATRWLHGKALYEAQEANAQWTAQWAEVLASDDDSEGRGRRRSIKLKGLDRYLADDFLGGGSFMDE